MKNLTLFRHAKSSWEYDVDDHMRPLKKRGRNDAHLVSQKLKDEDFSIDLIASSSANRAFATCKIFMNVLGISDEALKITDELYDFSGNQVIRYLKSLDNTYNNVLIFGHNHAFTSIANTYGDKHINNLPTSGVVSISFDIDRWQDINKGKTIKTLFPRDLK